ncbi:GNAT family N-acetyltransferase [Chloroflexota bacterium]
MFVAEQGISEKLVFDGNDDEAMQVIVKVEEETIGTARVRFLQTGQAKLERMAVLKPFRCRGAGRKIVTYLISELKKRGVAKLALHAQQGAEAFYESCGFTASGAPFKEAGIVHLEMKNTCKSRANPARCG